MGHNFASMESIVDFPLDACPTEKPRVATSRAVNLNTSNIADID